LEVTKVTTLEENNCRKLREDVSQVLIQYANYQAIYRFSLIGKYLEMFRQRTDIQYFDYIRDHMRFDGVARGPALGESADWPLQ